MWKRWAAAGRFLPLKNRETGHAGGEIAAPEQVIEPVGSGALPGPVLLEAIVSGRVRSAMAADFEISAWFEELAPEDIASADTAFRNTAWLSHPVSWTSLSPAELPLRCDGRVLPGGTHLAMMHRSGYVRESALRAADRYPSRATVPLALIRSLDMVYQVRAAAEVVLQNRFPDGDAGGCASLWPLLCRLGNRRSRSEWSWRERCARTLLSPESRPYLAAGLSSPRPGVARSFFELSTRLSAEETEPLWSGALGKLAPSLRSHVMHRLLEGSSGERREAYVSRCLGDGTPRLRAMGLEWLMKGRPGGELPEEIQTALGDRSEWVRLTAMAFVRRAGAEAALVAQVRGEFEKGAENPDRSLRILARFGDSSDVPSAVRMASRPEARVRIDALALIARHDDGPHHRLLIEALRDSDESVSAAAARLLKIVGTSGFVPELRRLASSDSPAGQRAFALLLRKHTAEVLDLALERLATGGREARIPLKDTLRCWASSGDVLYRKPSEETLGRIEVVLSRTRSRLPEEVVRSVEPVIVAWRR